MFEATLSLSQPQQLLTLFGACDQNLRLVCEALSVSITHRNGQLRVFGDEKEVAQATHVLEQMRGLVERQDALSREEVVEVLSHVTGDWSNAEMQVEVFQPSQQVRARTPGQARYMQAIRDYELVFAVGPAGTGSNSVYQDFCCLPMLASRPSRSNLFSRLLRITRKMMWFQAMLCQVVIFATTHYRLLIIRFVLVTGQMQGTVNHVQ